MEKNKIFPNGFDCWQETHYEIVSEIEFYLSSELSNTVNEAYDSQGRGGMWMLALELTDEFETTYKGVLWGEELDWYDTVQEFCRIKLEKNG